MSGGSGSKKLVGTSKPSAPPGVRALRGASGLSFATGSPRAGDNDLFTEGDALEQLGKVRFSFVNVDCGAHRCSID